MLMICPLHFFRYNLKTYTAIYTSCICFRKKNTLLWGTFQLPSLYLKTIGSLVISVSVENLEHDGVQPSAHSGDYEFASVALIDLQMTDLWFHCRMPLCEIKISKYPDISRFHECWNLSKSEKCKFYFYIEVKTRMFDTRTIRWYLVNCKNEVILSKLYNDLYNKNAL